MSVFVRKGHLGCLGALAAGKPDQPRQIGHDRRDDGQRLHDRRRREGEEDTIGRGERATQLAFQVRAEDRARMTGAIGMS